MKKTVLNVTSVLATDGMLFAGYVFFSSVPDIPRYIRSALCNLEALILIFTEDTGLEWGPMMDAKRTLLMTVGLQ
jgi:hypothetical protein